MRKSLLIAAAGLALVFSDPAASLADVLVARVDIGNQTMTVTQGGRLIYSWKVSTARKGYVTPRGAWRPTRMHKMWYSRKYDNAPMPYSVFYHGGYAIHGTSAVKRLGTPASHGCVRLNTANAQKFYTLVRDVGANNTRIIVN
ncbi:L,D-transpeptidase [Corticibacterium sp. UT-5YL-CI-8]|nr:L,D-transpeptidase [Tianweitania sp. UT-5YL-CI-8]